MSPRFAWLVSIPYRNISAPKEISGSAAKHIDRSFAGLGDSILFARYQLNGGLQAADSRLHVLVGVRLPTGSANPNHYWKAANGSLILSRDPVLQTGYGTLDPILGLQWRKPQSGGRALYAGTLFRHTLGTNGYGYRFGDEFQITAGASLPLGKGVTFSPQLFGLVSGHDYDYRPLPGKHFGEVGNTGGRWLYFMPNLHYGPLEMDFQIPIYRKTNGNILNPSLVISVHTSADLALTRAARVNQRLRSARGGIVPATGDFKVVSRGERVELTPYVVPGKITLFEFASRRCGACQATTPRLSELLAARADIALRQIDVTEPSAPAADQYAVKATPAFLIIDREGAQVSREPMGFAEVQTWLEKQTDCARAAPAQHGCGCR